MKKKTLAIRRDESIYISQNNVAIAFKCLKKKTLRGLNVVVKVLKLVYNNGALYHTLLK